MISNPLSLAGKVILVTGASSGIGRDTSILLAELGARVVLAARNSERLEQTREQMPGDGHRIVCVDLDDCDKLPAWLRELAAAEGPLNGLVYSAGVHKAVALRMANTASIEGLMRTNVTGAMMLVKAFRQKGCSAPGGSIVLLSSVAGLAGQPGITTYSASKAALMGYARSAAMELAPEGLRINCIAPGYVETEMAVRLRETLTAEQFKAIVDMHPLGTGRPRDVAHAAAFLLAETGRWITGSTLVVDGGYTAR